MLIWSVYSGLNLGLFIVLYGSIGAVFFKMAMVKAATAEAGFSVGAVLGGMLEWIFREDWLADITHFLLPVYYSFLNSGFFIFSN